MVIVDQFGRVIEWCLPGLLFPFRVVRQLLLAFDFSNAVSRRAFTRAPVLYVTVLTKLSVRQVCLRPGVHEGHSSIWIPTPT